MVSKKVGGTIGFVSELYYQFRFVDVHRDDNLINYL